MLAIQQDVREAERVSPSAAAGCNRRAFLLRDYEYYLDPQKQWASFQGTALHEMYAQAAPDSAETEMTLTSELEVTLDDGTKVVVPVSGTIDEYDRKLRRITDYKSVGWFRKYSNYQKKWLVRETPSEANVIQVNIYRWLCERNGYPVDEMFLWFVKRGDDPANPRRIVKAPVIPNDQLEDMLRLLALPIAEAMVNGNYPTPIPEDDEEYGWMCAQCPVKEVCRKLEKEGR